MWQELFHAETLSSQRFSPRPLRIRERFITT